ncbi:MAG: DNA-processing protein DprA [Clostridiales bacterium]|nr:DNA-processing protein DprA [Clostridiales bacterium]
MSDVKYWLWLTQTGGLSNIAAHKYLSHFGSVKKLYYASAEDYRLVPEARETEVKRLMNKRLDTAEKIETACRKLGVRIMTLYDADYPDRLRNIYDAPLVLYVKGELPRIDESPCIAIVGTRKAGPYGRRCAGKFGYDIARCGGVVISGLAEGIDSTAIQAAMEAGEPVVGVLGTGIDVVFPAWNTELQNAVMKNGALVSEYPPGTKGSRISFPQRNRIISGLSVGVVVIEAPEKSGSLITAARASEQGKDVYVVPGNIDDPNFVGSNLLIRDGAALAMNAWDVISCYRWQFPERIQRRDSKKRAVLEAVKRISETQKEKVNETETKKFVDKQNFKEYIDVNGAQLSGEELALVRALADGAKQTDELIEFTGMEASDVLSALTMLELEGYVRLNEEQRFELCP